MRLMRSGQQQQTRMHVAVVHGQDGIHFVAAAQTRAALMHQVAAYARDQADLQLYARDVAILTDMLERRDEEGAVRFYFQRVGQRWDWEWLRSELVLVADEGERRRWG